MGKLLNRYAGLATGLIAFIVYTTTTCRSIWIGDSGEFALALNTLGICHPPGYPLFTLLGRVFIMLMPFLRVTFAANIYNVLIASATVVAIYYLAKKYMSVPAAAIISLLWAFSPIFWAETAGVEVYPLNILLITLTWLAAESGHKRKWLITAYLFGLALTNHPSALAILPVLIYLFVRDKAYRRIELYPLMVAAIIIAGSMYLYLLVRASQQPLANWGNPDNIKALINHMTLEQYRGWIHQSWSNIILSLKLVYQSLMESWHWAGLILIIFGVIIGFKKFEARTISICLLLISLLMLSSSHQALDYAPFYLPAMLAFLLLIGNSIAWLESRFNGKLVQYTIYGIGILASLLMLITNYGEVDKSDYTLSEDYSRFLLDSAGEGILLTSGDINSFTTLYLRYIENYRPEVDVFDRSLRLSAFQQRIQRMTGGHYDDYYSARAALLRFSDKRIFLVKAHYVYDPEWLDIDVPYFSDGILYSVKVMLEQRHDVLKYPLDYNPDDILSRQLLVNLDLARGESDLKEQPYDSTAGTAAYNLAFKRLENEPRAIVLNNVGIYYRVAGFLDLALKTYELALQKPIITESTRRDIIFNISNVYKDRGNNFLSSGDFRNAARSFIEALKYDQGNPRLLLSVGLIYSKGLNDTSSACEYFSKYLESMPSDARVHALADSLGCR